MRAVLARSYERIHRSNLIGMGVLPLEFTGNDHAESLGLTGEEQLSIRGLSQLEPGCTLTVAITGADGKEREIEALCRIDTQDEMTYYRHGGILHYVIRNML